MGNYSWYDPSVGMVTYLASAGHMLYRGVYDPTQDYMAGNVLDDGGGGFFVFLADVAAGESLVAGDIAYFAVSQAAVVALVHQLIPALVGPMLHGGAEVIYPYILKLKSLDQTVYSVSVANDGTLHTQVLDE